MLFKPNNMKMMKLSIVIMFCLFTWDLEGQGNYYNDSLYVEIVDTGTSEFIIQGDTLVVTHNDTSNSIFEYFRVYLLRQAFPTAKTPFLQRIYLMVCDCNELVLKDSLEKYQNIFGVIERIGIPQLTGIIEKNTSERLFISPNPFTNLLTIAIADYQSYSYEIRNILGQVIHSGKLDDNLNRINLEYLNAGSYIIIIKSPGRYFETAKIIKR